jgi:primase-polymerase (primpol)-like protein
MDGCEICGRELTHGTRGPRKRFCGQTCRKRASRRAPFPAAMTERRTWTRAAGKRPLTPAGRSASSTNRSTWASFADVQRGPGSGFGIMLGDGLGVYDLDHVTDDEAQEFIDTISEPVVYAERSRSGDGVHVFIEAPEARGWKRTINGISVERYTRSRFVRTTGDTFAINTR